MKECRWVIWKKDSVVFDTRGECVKKGEKALFEVGILDTLGLDIAEGPSGEYSGVNGICVVKEPLKPTEVVEPEEPPKRKRGRPKKTTTTTKPKTTRARTKKA